MSENVTVTRVAALPLTALGESPMWDEKLHALLYVDIDKTCIHRYYPATNRHQIITLAPTDTGSKLSMAVPLSGRPERLLVSVGRDLGLIEWKESDPDESSTELKICATVDEGRSDNKLNDGKCDSKGRLWIGTYGNIISRGVAEVGQGRLFRFSDELSTTVVLPEVTLANGLGWSPDQKKFYFVDTSTFKVDCFDFNEETGDISNRRVFFDFRAKGYNEGFPDGLTVDVEGNVWVAHFLGAQILCIDGSTGEVIRTVPMPVDRPTCPAWGGPDYSTLYVTTTTLGMSKEEMERKPDSGAVFAVTGTGCQGAAHHRAVVHDMFDELFLQA